MTQRTPIADALGVAELTAAGARVLRVNGQDYDYIPPHDGYLEGMYRRNPGHGSSNACFSITDWQPRPDVVEHIVGVYLAGGSHQSNPRRVGKDEARATLERARATAEGWRNVRPGERAERLSLVRVEHA